MIRVEYRDKTALKKAYLKKFKRGLLQNGLDVCISEYPELATILSAGCKADALLVMEFDSLVDVYFGYQGLRSTMGKISQIWMLFLRVHSIIRPGKVILPVSS